MLITFEAKIVNFQVTSAAKTFKHPPKKKLEDWKPISATDHQEGSSSLPGASNAFEVVRNRAQHHQELTAQHNKVSNDWSESSPAPVKSKPSPTLKCKAATVAKMQEQLLNKTSEEPLKFKIVKVSLILHI